MRIAVINLTGGKAERDALRYKGHHGMRAQILLNDTLSRNRGINAICINGMSDYQKSYVDSFLAARGFRTLCMSPAYKKQTGKHRFTQLSAIYCRDSLKAKNLRYNERTVSDLKYRYAALTLNGTNNVKEIRVLHIPCCDADRPHYDEQRSRKERLLRMERTLELYETNKGKTGIIACGDFNTAPHGTGESQKLFDSLPYTKLLNEPTWHDSCIDNVLVSDDLKQKVHVKICGYRVGQTSDHHTVILDVDD